MNQKLARLLRSPRRMFGAVICVVGAVLLISSIANALNDSPSSSSPPPETPIVAGAQQSANNNTATDPPPATESPPGTTSPTKPNTTQTQSTAAPQASEPKAAPQPNPSQNTITVSLEINNTAVGEVAVPPDSNQCEVLSKARDQGVIQNVSMQWYAQYNSYFVTKINGVTGSWTYKVNGLSPPVGCSNTKAQSGDTVHWENDN